MKADRSEELSRVPAQRMREPSNRGTSSIVVAVVVNEMVTMVTVTILAMVERCC